ncbi:MAG: P-II family nitrogen regulator [Clostridia bacterium]|nr:P-II family nitrogen regulator [Clostridia bacterium]
MEFTHEVIFCIVNDGFGDEAMNIAKKAGATGGTIINARGSASKSAESYFHIVIQPEKEIVMILVPSEQRDAILHALYREAGLETPGHGIVFSLPVDNVIGMNKSVGAENK